MHSERSIFVTCFGTGETEGVVAFGGVGQSLVVDTLAISCTSRDTSTERTGELLPAIAKMNFYQISNASVRMLL